jgi:glycosyltransferase involved in cell wall biosynthesis
MLAESAGAEVLRMPSNAGKGAALNMGFARARALRPQVVVMLDGDAQHDPAEIPHLVRPVLDGVADVVVGSRFLDIRSEIPRWRQLGQHTLNLMTNKASGVTISDSQSGYRAFRPAALDALRWSMPSWDWSHGGGRCCLLACRAWG